MERWIGSILLSFCVVMALVFVVFVFVALTALLKAWSIPVVVVFAALTIYFHNRGMG